MKIQKLITCVCVLSLVATAAVARVHCSQDGVGGSKCVGYNSNGEYVSLRSRTNASGLTTTQGRIGNRAVNTRSRMGAKNRGAASGMTNRPQVQLRSAGRPTTPVIGGQNVRYIRRARR